MPLHPGARPLEPLRGLKGAYVVIEADGIFGDNYADKRTLFRRETFQMAETRLQSAGFPVLPSFEELELTSGHAVISLGAQILTRPDTDQISYVCALHLGEFAKLERNSHLCYAVTWQQIALGLAPMSMLWPSIAQSMQNLVDMFAQDYRAAQQSE